MNLNNTIEMTKLFSVLQKTITNPYFGVLLSLLLIIPSLYIIIEDISIMRKEYVILVIGIVLYIKSLNSIFDDALNQKNDSF